MNSFFKSFTYALKGLALSIKQRNFKFMLFCAVFAIALGIGLHINLTEWCIILTCIGITLTLETFNTALEHFVDLVEPNFNPKAGAVKDLAAAAVFLFSMIALVIGILIFGKYILALIVNHYSVK